MTEQARVVVIGGGVTGCSVLYHLVKKGWRDVVLCERTELTAGSTWHSAGHVILYTLNETVSRLNQYGVELYRKLEEETGQDPGFHTCGNMRLATHPDRLLEMKRYLGIAEITGVEAHLLSLAEVRELHPLMNTDGVLAGLLNPRDGHIAPAGLTQALAAGARQGGAKIHRMREVAGLTREASGEWRVQTNKGDIRCEHVVSATGNYTKQTMALVGLPGHSVPVKHQYVVTEAIPALVERRQQGLPELPVFRDPELSFYVRQEGEGLAMGAYEAKGEAVFVDGVPASFGQDLFPDELDKLLPFFELAMTRLPLLAETGIRSVINGPMPYTPDDLPLTGPAPGLKNLWLAEGNPFGITLAGGIGWQLADWIVEGEPSIDMWTCDARRFGSHASRAYCAVKTEEAYEHTYRVPKPGQELEAARGMKTSALHDLLAAKGAVFGEAAGWERPNWFAAEGMEAAEDASFGRTNAFPRVARECEAIDKTAGLADITAQARFLVEGPEATKALDRIFATKLPAPGVHATCYAVTRKGTIRSEMTLWREGETRFFLTGPIAAEGHDLDLLTKSLAGKDARLTNLTGRLGGLPLAGPKAGDILAKIDDQATSENGDRTNPGRHCTLALAPARVLSFGEGMRESFEIHAPMEHLRRICLALLEVGEEDGLTLVGARAMESLRLEAACPAWGPELNRAVGPFAAGLEDSIDFSKADFCGREALLQLRGKAPEKRLVLLALKEGAPWDPVGGEPVRDAAGQMIGATTSSGYGHLRKKALALVYVEQGLAEDDKPCQIVILGERCPARFVQPL